MSLGLKTKVLTVEATAGPAGLGVCSSVPWPHSSALRNKDPSDLNPWALETQDLHLESSMFSKALDLRGQHYISQGPELLGL